MISNDEKFEGENVIFADGDADADGSDMIRYRGRVAYDGSGFRGWQVQANGRTVQVREHFFLPNILPQFWKTDAFIISLK